MSPDVGVDFSYRAEAGGPHAVGLLEDRLDALLAGSAGPVMWDALSSELAAITEQTITKHHWRSDLEWAETKLHIAHDISPDLHGYTERLLPQAAGAACSIVARRAEVHGVTLLHAVRDRHPRIDIDAIEGERTIGGPTI